MCCVMGYTGHDLSAAKFKEYLLRTVMRGPDDQRVVEGPFGLMGFGRLAIMGLTPEGMQPFYRGADCVVCNGELYGFRFEKEILKRRGYKFQSDCDCEILLPLYYEYGLDMFRHMDAEFALILYDSRKDRLIAARDPIGIRPLFYGYSKSSHQIAFASEMQNLIGWCDDIRPFPIGSYYCDGRFVRYEDIADVPAPMQDDMDTILTNIREKLIAGVEKRLDADAPVGFLLSGGLDSSLVCSIAAKKLGKPIRTFAIGMDTDAIDLKYARQTAEYLGSEHHEIIINRDMVISSLEEVIRLLGTWALTTNRASMGSIFQLRLHVYDDFSQYQAQFPEHALYPFMLDGSKSMPDVLGDIPDRWTLIFGNEGSGLPPEFSRLGQPVRIPSSNKVDSLNLSIAAAIGIYAFARR